MKNLTLKKFIESSNISTDLIRAVIKQSGGWEYFRENSICIAKYGVDIGFYGWTYYYETESFFTQHRKKILEFANQQADEFGMDFFKFISELKCMKSNNISTNDIIKCFYRGKEIERDLKFLITNCMSWYVVEEVSREYYNFINSKSKE